MMLSLVLPAVACAVTAPHCWSGGPPFWPFWSPEPVNITPHFDPPLVAISAECTARTSALALGAHNSHSGARCSWTMTGKRLHPDPLELFKHKKHKPTHKADHDADHDEDPDAALREARQNLEALGVELTQQERTRGQHSVATHGWEEPWHSSWPCASKITARSSG